MSKVSEALGDAFEANLTIKELEEYHQYANEMEEQYQRELKEKDSGS